MCLVSLGFSVAYHHMYLFIIGVVHEVQILNIFKKEPTKETMTWLINLWSLWHSQNKTAELSQRRPRDAPNIWVPWKVLRVLTTHPATFPEISNGLLFRSILWMCVQNLKFVALPVPEIIGGTPKIWAVPGYARSQFSPKIIKGFCSDGPSEAICQIWRP